MSLDSKQIEAITAAVVAALSAQDSQPEAKPAASRTSAKRKPQKSARATAARKPRVRTFEAKPEWAGEIPSARMLWYCRKFNAPSKVQKMDKLEMSAAIGGHKANGRW